MNRPSFRSLALLPFALGVLPASGWSQIPQPPIGTWSEPIILFGAGNTKEIAHGALIPVGAHQGKVVLWRRGVEREAYLWDPAAPGTHSPAGAVRTSCSPHIQNIDHHLFCAGHAWNRDGELVTAGGALNWIPVTSPPTCSGSVPCTSAQPTWTYTFDPKTTPNPTWTRRGDMLPPPLQPLQVQWGYYYPSVVALFNGWMISLGGTTPALGETMCNVPIQRSNTFLLFNPSTFTWQGQSPTLGYPGLPLGPIPQQPQSESLGLHYYPIVHLLRSGYLFASVVYMGGKDKSVTPNLNYSLSALLDLRNPTPFPPTTSPTWTFQHPDNRLRTDGSPGTVNLLYPTSVLAPYRIDAAGQPIGDEAVIVFGGFDAQGQQPVGPPTPGPDTLRNVWRIQNPHLTATSYLDPTTPGTRWERYSSDLPVSPPTGRMNFAREYGNAVLMPDLSAIVFGGSSTEFFPFSAPNEPFASPVYTPERLDLTATAPVWEQLAPHQSPRLYHAIGLLLKDGRVALMGGYTATVPDPLKPPLQHSDCEILSPPYLQVAAALGARPAITAVSSNMFYNTPFTCNVTVSDGTMPAADIEYATLIRCGSVTHHFDWDQRAIRLDIVSRTSTSLTLAPLPAAGGSTRGDYLAPPGWYMLFAVSRPLGNPPTRIPSVALFVKVQ